MMHYSNSVITEQHYNILLLPWTFIVYFIQYASTSYLKNPYLHCSHTLQLYNIRENFGINAYIYLHVLMWSLCKTFSPLTRIYLHPLTSLYITLKLHSMLTHMWMTLCWFIYSNKGTLQMAQQVSVYICSLMKPLHMTHLQPIKYLNTQYIYLWHGV